MPGAFQLLPPMRQFVVSDPRAMSSLVVLASGLALASGEKLLLKLSKLFAVFSLLVPAAEPTGGRIGT